jgi:hypothetical protein
MAKGERRNCRRKAFTLEYKKWALQWIKEKQGRITYQFSLHVWQTKGEKVNYRTVLGWLKSQDQLESFDLPKTSKRLVGAGRHPALGTDGEEELAALIRQERSNHSKVKTSQIKDWALTIAERDGIKGFAASSCWLYNFFEVSCCEVNQSLRFWVC